MKFLFAVVWLYSLFVTTASISAPSKKPTAKPTTSSVGSWKEITKSWCNTADCSGVFYHHLLLPDETVWVFDSYNPGSKTYRLYPDGYGSYVNGNWYEAASIPAGYAPLYCATAVSPDGNVLVISGEYNAMVDVSDSKPSFTGGVIYDPYYETMTVISSPTFFDS